MSIPIVIFTLVGALFIYLVVRMILSDSGVKRTLELRIIDREGKPTHVNFPEVLRWESGDTLDDERFNSRYYYYRLKTVLPNNRFIGSFCDCGSFGPEDIYRLHSGITNRTILSDKKKDELKSLVEEHQSYTEYLNTYQEALDKLEEEDSNDRD